jgi:site-specific DNA recombinase
LGPRTKLALFPSLGKHFIEVDDRRSDDPDRHSPTHRLFTEIAGFTLTDLALPHQNEFRLFTLLVGAQCLLWRLFFITEILGGFTTFSAFSLEVALNPFYYGAMRIKDRLCPHKYPPLISQGLFDRCTEVQLGKTRATATRYSEKPFVFRGLIKCATSGRTVTSDLKKGKHLYLICRDPLEHTNKLFVPETTVLDQINAALSSIRIPDHLLDALLTHMKTSHAAEKRFHADAITSLRRDCNLINERLATLLDLRLDKSITQSEYDKKALSLKYKQAEIAARIEQHQLGNSNFRTTLETLITLASRAVELFERSKTEQKRQLIALVFSNLRLRGKKLEYSLRSPFDLMVNRPTHTSWLGD